jgi:GPH family glycoside/pentoside/hexuronide:cation symporter
MKLSFLEKFGFGLGDTASNFIWATLSSFLMFYYTDIFGISASAVGVLLLVARCLDGFVDLTVGAVADRTNTRWGKFRPYILWTCVPLGVLMVLTFTTPDFSPSWKLVYAWVTYNLLMILYTVINIPYSALSGVMTDDPLDRTSLNSYRMSLAQVGGLIVNACTLPLIKYFGANGGMVDQHRGYQLTMLLFACLAVVLFLVTFATTKERIQPPPTQESNLWAELGMLFRNPQWLMMLAAGIIAMTFMIVRGGIGIYYFRYYVGDKALADFYPWLASAGNPLLHQVGQRDIFSAFLVTGSIAAIFGATLTRFLVKFTGKKGGYIFTMMVMSLTAAVYYWIPGDAVGVMLLFQIFSCAIGMMNATLFWTMIADTADYAEWRFKVRTTGMIFSATTASQKIGMGIAGAVSGFLLAHFGYVANHAQTAEALHGIVLMMSLIPAIGFMVLAVIFCFYGLNEKRLEEIRADLARRRSAA